MPHPLTLAHRAAQLGLRASVLLEVARVMRDFDVAGDVDKEWRGIERALVPTIGEARSRSTAIGVTYYRNIRAAEGVTTALPVIRTTGTEWLLRARVSLSVAGPIWTKTALGRRKPVDQVAAESIVRVAGVAGRVTLEGGRDTVARFVRAERIRWQRVTSADPCAFCAMLRDRGAVYVERTVHFAAHDHCGCTAEPVFGTRRGGRL